MKAISISTLAVLVTVTLIGSIAATATLLQQASAQTLIEKKKEFNGLTKQFKRDVLSLMADPPRDADTQLAMLFHDYEMATFRIFGLTPP